MVREGEWAKKKLLMRLVCKVDVSFFLIPLTVNLYWRVSKDLFFPALPQCNRDTFALDMIDLNFIHQVQTI